MDALTRADAGRTRRKPAYVPDDPYWTHASPQPKRAVRSRHFGATCAPGDCRRLIASRRSAPVGGVRNCGPR